MWSETFHFDPATIVDPLADYFGGVRNELGGLRFRSPRLSLTPQAVRVVLNEWARFPAPGKYRFFVRSTRVSQTKPRNGVPTLESFELTSANVLELEISAAGTWADAELKRVVALLDAGGDEEKMSAARRALRFLTTPAAARAMVDDLCRPAGAGDDPRWHTQAGLYGSPDRAAVIALLEEGLSHPDCAVSTHYLNLLTRLRVRAASAGRSPKLTPEALAAARKATLQSLLLALHKKTPETRPGASFAALETMTESDPALLKSAIGEQLRRELAKSVATLPDATLESLLERRWDLIRMPVTVPALLQVASEARPRGSRLRSLSDVALERLLELDFEVARKFILSELERGARIAFSGSTLGMLKEKGLPALDKTLARELRAPESDAISLELRAELFARYASKAVLADAHAAFREESYFRVALLAYFSRHDPKFAEAAIAAIADVDSLRRLGNVLWNHAVENAVVAKLDTPSGAEAARLLAERGSANVEKVLWSKLAAVKGVTAKAELAEALRNGIRSGNAWMTPAKRLRDLAATCGDDEGCKGNVTALLDRWGDDGTHPQLVLWSTRGAGGGTLTGWLGSYDVRSASELERRIGQLPAGTTLVWGTTPNDVDAVLMANVRKWAARRRVTITDKP